MIFVGVFLLALVIGSHDRDQIIEFYVVCFTAIVVVCFALRVIVGS